MIKIIESDLLTVSIDTLGAEIKSVKNVNGTEFMWNGNPDVWNGVAPTLFPICGCLNGGKYEYNGEEYRLQPHGFAKDSEFTLETFSANEAVFLLKSDEKTKKLYPFDFEFRVKFKVTDVTLEITYLVKNTGIDVMYFSLGSHEGYSTPGGVESYNIVFDGNVDLKTLEVDSNGLITPNSKEIVRNTNILPIYEEYFDWDTIVLKDIECRRCTLVSKNDDRRIRIEFDDFSHLMIWHMVGCDFICIEPWTGFPDIVDCTGRLEEKYSMTRLNPSDTHMATHKISFVNEGGKA